MSFFNDLLEKRGYNKCPLPLWKLKLTDEEFEELRQILEKRTHIINEADPFRNLRKECTLFFAEYWRRIYKSGDGAHSKKKVYAALKSTCPLSTDYVKEFYDAAVRGAQTLSIEQYDGALAQILEDMLYQGGLPMRMISENISNSLWDTFTRGLVNKRISFEELNLGLIATQSQCLKEFCEQLIKAIETGQTQLAPFYCEKDSNGWNWFTYLCNLSKQEHARSRQNNPFTLDWVFKFDMVEKKFNINYIIKGLQQLPSRFIEDQNLQTNNFISVHIKDNGKIIDSFDYVNKFCRYEVKSQHIYHTDSEIALYLQEREIPQLSGYLEMNVPRLLYLCDNGHYKLGNRLRRLDSLLILPSGWQLQNEDSLSSQIFTWNNCEYNVVNIPSTYAQDLTVKGPEEEIINYGLSTPLCWTELSSHPLPLPIINETLYNADNCRFLLCSRNENDDIEKIPSNNILFRDNRGEWQETASYGKISVMATDRTGKFVAPMRFINVGSGMSVHLIYANSEVCQMRVFWEHGHISTDEGVRRANDVWEIRKCDCKDPRNIHFLATPNENGNNCFTISIKAPFKDFSIKDIYGEELPNNSLLPYTDLDKYQYHLVGQGIKEYRYGNIVRKLEWYDQDLYITENNRRVRQIPYEGNLTTLFDSREAIRSLLEKTSLNILRASVKVVFKTDNDREFRFEIKESPFRAMQLDGGKINITANYEPINSFRGMLKLLKFDEPTREPVEMFYDTENGYVLPEEIRSWGKSLLISETKGRLCPLMVNFNSTPDTESRKQNRDDVIKSISKELQETAINDELWQRITDWFYIKEKENIPASSLLEFYCVAHNPDALIKLAFLLFTKCNSDDERDILSQQLETMSDELAFQWNWISPYLNMNAMRFEQFINDLYTNRFKDIYISWAMRQGEQMIDFLSALNSDSYFEKAIQCYVGILGDFDIWIKELCCESLTRSYSETPSEATKFAAKNIINSPTNLRRIESEYVYVNVRQDLNDDDVTEFFNQFDNPSLAANERWCFNRIKAVAAHIRGEINLFEEDDVVRRSIIYCNKSCVNLFAIALNNKLI